MIVRSMSVLTKRAVYNNYYMSSDNVDDGAQMIQEDYEQPEYEEPEDEDGEDEDSDEEEEEEEQGLITENGEQAQ